MVEGEHGDQCSVHHELEHEHAMLCGDDFPPHHGGTRRVAVIYAVILARTATDELYMYSCQSRFGATCLVKASPGLTVPGTL